MLKRHTALAALLAALALPAFAADPVPPADAALDARVEDFLAHKRADWGQGINRWNVPESGARHMHDLVRERDHTRILDIGTSTGHSALWLAWAAAKNGGTVLTIEVDPARHAEAVRNFEASGLAPYIDARLADAHALVEELPGPWDFVFQDADKGWSLNYWNAVKDKITPRGCFAMDHVTHSSIPAIVAFADAVRADARFEHYSFDMGGFDLFVACRGAP